MTHDSPRLGWALVLAILCLGIGLASIRPALVGAQTPASDSPVVPALAEQAAAIFLDKCYRCHGVEHADGNDAFNILDSQFLLKSGHAAAGEGFAQSLIHQRITSSDDRMPPAGEPELSAAEIATLDAWMKAGAQPLDSQPFVVAGSIVAQEKCYACHGIKQLGNPKFNILNARIYAESDDPFVAHGDLEASKIWQYVATDKMPKGKEKLTEAEKLSLRRWIQLGGQVAVPQAEREWVSAEQELQSIVQDLRNAKEEDRATYRYVSLRNVYNNPKQYTEQEFLDHQAALPIVCNSLSYERRIAPLTKIDDKGTLWRIDLKDYGWEQPRYEKMYQVDRVGVWRMLSHSYPYGVDFRSSENRQQRDLAMQIDEMAGLGGEHPVLRGDWLVYNAAQGEMYNLLMGIPKNTNELERELGVDRQQDFLNGDAVRAAVKVSGVSIGNRAMDRHQTRLGGGYYWISYDFIDGGQRSDLNRFPLGPAFPGNPYNQLAFEHDGGEIIFALPNGLQGYALTDQLGNRLEVGPNEVVKDELNTIGTGQVSNAISCMRCHAGGMKNFEDDVFANVSVGGEALRFARTLYDEERQLKQQLEADSESFQRAVRQCLNDLQWEEAAIQRVFDPLTNPIGSVAQKFIQPMSIDHVASELDWDNAESLQSMISASPSFRRIGLNSLGQNGTIRRIDWETTGGSNGSLYQQSLRLSGQLTPKTYSNSRATQLFKAYRAR